MSTPYWGELPPPKVVRHDSIKRESDPNYKGKGLSVNTTADRLSFQSASQQPRQNRASMDAPTVSTQSPFASPTAESFRGDGLAPRPPSFSRGADPSHGTDREFEDRRRRRESRNRELYDEPSAPPAVPDAPRVPPANYKLPFGGAGPSTNYEGLGRSKVARRSDAGISPTTVAPPEDFYRINDARRENNMQGKEDQDHTGQAITRRVSNGKPIVRSNTLDSRRERLDSRTTLESQSRKGSLASESDSNRRRDWAPDKSPLQRLERRLDSITKEEKRTRMEEAEKRLRETKATAAVLDEDPTPPNTVRFRNRSITKAPENIPAPEFQRLPEPSSESQHANPPNNRAARNEAAERRQPVPTAIPAAPARGLDQQPEAWQETAPPTQRRSSGAQRGGSFRDRIGTDTVAGTAAGLAAPEISRSGSNKLRKEPPENYLSNRGPPPVSTGSSEGIGTGPYHFRQANRPSDENDLAPAGDTGQSVRRAPVRKIEQLTGASDLSRLPKTEVISGNQIPPNATRRGSAGGLLPQPAQREKAMAFPAPSGPGRFQVSQSGNGAPTVVPAQGQHDGQAQSQPRQQQQPQQHQQAHHHHLSNLLHHGKGHHIPNEGVYVAGRRLDEWKTGGVALLAGKLLDLEPELRSEPEKDVPWWEKGKQRRGSVSNRKAEAYEGEYDDTTGKQFYYLQDSKMPPWILLSYKYIYANYITVADQALQGLQDSSHHYSSNVVHFSDTAAYVAKNITIG